jgi:hypothetical protein
MRVIMGVIKNGVYYVRTKGAGEVKRSGFNGARSSSATGGLAQEVTPYQGPARN